MLGKFTTDETNGRGQVGIGTLIVFIAMVLVAAIAAGVLINTAGVLQTQASDTGSETQEQVANQIEVLHASGDVDTDTGTIESVDMTLMKSAGSNEIDIESMTVQYTSSHTDKTLNYGAEANSNQFGTAELSGDNQGTSLTTKDDRVEMTLNTTLLEADEIETHGEIEISGTGTDEEDATVASVSIDDQPYNGNDLVLEVTEGSNYDNITWSGETLGITADSGDLDDDISDELAEGDEITIGADQFDNDDTLTFQYASEGVTGDIDTQELEGGLAPGSSATVALVDQSGAQFTYGISVPSTFGTATVVEV